MTYKLIWQSLWGCINVTEVCRTVTLLSRLATRMFPLGIKRGQGPLVPIAQRLAWSTPLVVLLGSIASLSEGTGISLLIPLMSQLTGGALPRALPGAIREVVELLEPCAVETDS